MFLPIAHINVWCIKTQSHKSSLFSRFNHMENVVI